MIQEFNTTTQQYSSLYTQRNNNNFEKENTKKEISADINISQIDIKEQNSFNLESITPKETAALAKNLHSNGKITKDDMVHLMITAMNHALPPGTETEQANDYPFNLIKDLELSSKSEHPYFTNTTEEDRSNIENLLQVLLGLDQEQLSMSSTTVDIKI